MGVALTRMGVGFTRAAPRRRIMPALVAMSVSALVGIGVTASAVTALPRARVSSVAVASRLQYMTEKSQMHLASAPGVTIKEQGSIAGTFNGSSVAYFTSTSISRGSLILTANLSGGTITVRGETHNRVSGSTGYSEGTLRITHGTGKFAHASSSTLRFHAVVNRKNFYITAEVHGPMSL